MKKIGLFLLAVAVVAGIAGCGGGGGDDLFDFNGQWFYAGTVVASSVPSVPVGSVIQDIATVVAAPPNFAMDFPGDVPPYVGTCDPVAGTFQGQFFWQGLTGTVVGHAIDFSVMEGSETLIGGPVSVAINWRMTLRNRQAGTQGSGSRDALLKAIAASAGDKR